MVKSLAKSVIRLAFPYALRLQLYLRSLVFENLEIYKQVFGLEGINNLLLHAPTGRTRRYSGASGPPSARGPSSTRPSP